jgi:hypothetical protein
MCQKSERVAALVDHTCAPCFCDDFGFHGLLSIPHFGQKPSAFELRDSEGDQLLSLQLLAHLAYISHPQVFSSFSSRYPQLK